MSFWTTRDRTGFYFTILIGREENALGIDEDTGWLIGEAILDNGALKGTIEFHPYGATRPVIQDWSPRLMKP